MPFGPAAVGFFVMLGATIACIFMLPEYPAPVGDPPLFYSASFLMDWILGLELAAVIWFYTRAFATITYPETVIRAVQWVANHTFSIYLYHYPTILFFYAVGILNPAIWWQAILEIALILGLILALSEVTESKRGLWKKAFEWIWAKWEPRVPPTPGPRTSASDLVAEP